MHDRNCDVGVACVLSEQCDHPGARHSRTQEMFKQGLVEGTTRLRTFVKQFLQARHLWWPQRRLAESGPAPKHTANRGSNECGTNCVAHSRSWGTEARAYIRAVPCDERSYLGGPQEASLYLPYMGPLSRTQSAHCARAGVSQSPESVSERPAVRARSAVSCHHDKNLIPGRDQSSTLILLCSQSRLRRVRQLGASPPRAPS